MKLFRKKEMETLETAAGRAGVSLEELMENAGTSLAEEAASRCRPITGRQVVLLCGRGNNGGDGFVCARHLHSAGAVCTVLLVQGEPRTGLAKAAFDKIPQSVNVQNWRTDPQSAESLLEKADLVLDCVFGFSFHGELPGELQDIFTLANARSCMKLSADLPSGAECDTGRLSKGAFMADVTVTFTAEKPACRSYPAKEACGEVVIRQVGVPGSLTAAAETGTALTDRNYVRPLLKTPGPQSNKGDLGKLLLVCGGYGMAGACIMAAQAALRCGVGLLRIATDASIYPIVAQAVPEAVFFPLDRADRSACEQYLEEALKASTACVVGCGLGKLAETLCPTVFSHCKIPLVIDADGLNFCARHSGALNQIQAPLVITPHPGEAARLAGRSVAEIQQDRIEAAKSISKNTDTVTVLKGAATVIANPEGRCLINPTGNAGMAKGGSGDVLAGIIGSFMAQGLSPFQAAGAGAYLHGLAGDICARSMGQRFMLPTDLTKSLQQAFVLVE